LFYNKTISQVLPDNLIFKGPIHDNPNPALIIYEEQKDSLDFFLINAKFVSGKYFIKAIYDRKEIEYHWKKYNENGNLKEEGTFVSENKICVGLWKYYSESGKIDSIINFDEKFKISYFMAKKIALENDFKSPYLEVNLKTIDDKIYWEFIKWNYTDGKVIIIDTETGLVKTPNYKVGRNF